MASFQSLLVVLSLAVRVVAVNNDRIIVNDSVTLKCQFTGGGGGKGTEKQETI
jgi:hypothetical protein